jgi:diguanylate cyclase (GGDEF)-like protein/PAS domain S-box-containing protein
VPMPRAPVGDRVTDTAMAKSPHPFTPPITVGLCADDIKTAIDFAADEVFISDIEGNILYVNESACQTLGYSMDELTAMKITDLNPELTQADIRKAFAKARKEGRQLVEVFHRREDGTLFPVEISFDVKTIGGTEVSCAIVRDITVRNKIEEETEQLRFAVDNAPDAVYIFGKDGNIRYANKIAEKELGYSVEELRTMNVTDIDPVLSGSREGEKLKQQRWSKVLGGEHLIFETVHRRKDGTTFPVEGTHCAFKLGGEDIGFSSVRNITERKKALRKTEELQFAIDHATDAIYICDSEGKFYYVNQSASHMLGYEREQMLSMTVFDINPTLDIQEFRHLWESAQQDNGIPVFETRHRKSDGTDILVEINTRITDFDGNKFACSFARDITERKEAMRKSEELEFAIDNAVDAVYLCDKEGNFYYVNDSASRMLGYSRDELTRMSVFDVDPTVTPAIFENLWNTKWRNSTTTFETRNRRNDGTEIPIEITTRISEFEGNEYACSFARDISERKKAARLMEEFRFAIDNANDAVYLYNRAGDITYANLTACETLGYTYEELTGMKVWDLDTEVTEEVWEHIYPEVKAGNVKTFESRNKRKDGSIFPVEVTATNVTYGDNEFGCSFNHDITERKKTERQMLFTQFAIDSAGDAIFFTNPAGDILYANQTACDSLGYTREELLNLKVKDINPEVEKLADDVEYWTNNSGGDPHFVISNHKRKDGTIFPIEIQARVIEFDGEQFSCGVVRDITDRLQAQNALRESEEKFRVIADTSPVAMVISRMNDNTIIYANKQVQTLFDRNHDEILGRSLPELFDSARTREELLYLLKSEKQLLGHEVMLKKKDGSDICLSLSSRTISLQGDEVIYSALLDVTEAYELAQQLSYQASYDPLTGLVNRREFQSHLHRTIVTARQRRTENALCFLDLDQFKVVNDTCGHIAGDELLRQLAQILKSNIRKQDVLARLGGDEFAILLENCSLQQAERVANSIRLAVQDFRFHWEDNTFSVGVSIGLVPVDWTSETTTDLLRRADTACYTAKDKGRNRIHIYHPNDEELTKRHGEMKWISRINEALTRNHLQLWAQPIISLGDDTIGKGDHFELLVRMQDADGNVITPDAFLPTAERYSIAARIDRWVITTILNWYSQNPDKFAALALCSINLSGQSLSDEEILRYVVNSFENIGIDPRKFCFEITETAAIANLTNATHFIKTLKERGVRFSLDDFGSGLSSFAYLKNLPVDYLKIDGQFVKDVLVDPIDLAMVKSINDIGHVMGKKTIAEFVETRAILDIMEDIGIDYAQGYGIAKPSVLIGGAAIQNIYSLRET